jgi:hypothetical protein
MCGRFLIATEHLSAGNSSSSEDENDAAAPVPTGRPKRAAFSSAAGQIKVQMRRRAPNKNAGTYYMMLLLGLIATCCPLSVCGALAGLKPSTKKSNKEYLEIWRKRWHDKTALRTAKANEVYKERSAKHFASTVAAEVAATSGCPAPAPIFKIPGKLLENACYSRGIHTALDQSAIAHRKVCASPALPYINTSCSAHAVLTVGLLRQAVQPPHPELQLQDLPLQKYRNPVSWTLYSPKPRDFLAEIPPPRVEGRSSPMFLGCLRFDLDPAFTEREDLEAVFEYMQQHPGSSRFELRMQTAPVCR